MPKQLSEAAAWRKLAEWCAENPHDAKMGLCALLNMDEEGDPFHGKGYPLTRMYNRLRKSQGYGTAFGAWLDTLYDYDIPNRWNGIPPIKLPHSRVIFCLFMALEAKEDAK